MVFLSNLFDLDIYVKEKIFENFEFVIYGAGKKAIEVIEEFNNINSKVTIKYIVDNNKALSGTKLHGIDIIWYDDFIKCTNKYVVVYSILKSRYIEILEKDIQKGNKQFELIRLNFPNKGALSFETYLYEKRINNFEIKEEYNNMFYGRPQEKYKDIAPYYQEGAIKLHDFESQDFNIIAGKRQTLNKIVKNNLEVNKIFWRF